VKAVNDVSLFIKKGETLSVAGEGGCGKSTLARVVMGLYSPNSGEVYYSGKRIDNLINSLFYKVNPFKAKRSDIRRSWNS